MFLRYVPPMGIYETLYAFMGTFGRYMGEPGTHPWSQGFPRTDQLPGGPPLPSAVTVTTLDRRYPKAWGLPELRNALASYYTEYYGTAISPENVMVFAGGRPALTALLLFLEPDVEVRIASTEYTPYYDLLKGLRRSHHLVKSGADNGFRPPISKYIEPREGKTLVLLSNPCNPTGITRTGDELEALVRASEGDHMGVLVDEAYELLHAPPVSAIAHVQDIEETNLFVVGAATKGLQAPGIRIGWVVGARRHIEVLSNFSSFGMGGVAHPSQRYALELLDPDRIPEVRRAVPKYYLEQRERYGEAFARLGLELFSGTGGFYHWCRIPRAISAEALNERLFRDGAAILKGTDCDMLRLGDESPLRSFFRFSFGPLDLASFDSDVELMERALADLSLS